MGVLNVVLLYRPIGSVGRLTVVPLGGHPPHHRRGDRDRRPALRPQAWPSISRPAPSISRWASCSGLGAAARVGVYDYLGYYDVCYIGDEVKNPGRVIPRSILISIVGVAIIYIAINLSIIGVVPWREFVPAADHPSSDFVVSIFMERLYGSEVATVFTAA